MLGWWFVLFTLSFLSFLDGFMSYGDIFRQVNSSALLLVSMALLGRIAIKMRQRSKEKLAARVTQLEDQLGAPAGDRADAVPPRDVTVPNAVGA